MKQYRHRRSANPANPFPTLEPGELSVNTANRQLAVGDANVVGVGTPLPLIAIRYFDPRASYLANDMVVETGKLYVAIAAVPPGPFNAAQWTEFSGAGGGGGDYLPLTGGTLTGPLGIDIIAGSFSYRSDGFVYVTPPGGGGTQGFILGHYGGNQTYGQFDHFNDDLYSEGLYFQYAQGTAAAPLALTPGCEIGGIAFTGFDGSAYQTSVAIFAAVDGDAVAGAGVPLALCFKTGSTSYGTERLRIGSDGSSFFKGGVNVIAPAPYFSMLSPPGANVPCSIEGGVGTKIDWSDYQTRWTINLGDGIPEGPGNVGCNFTITRADNNGVVLGTPLTIDRASGQVLVAQAPTQPNSVATKSYAVARAGDTMTGDLTIDKTAPLLILNDVLGGNTADVRFNRNGKRRWLWRLGGDAESGGNAGSSLTLVRYDDDGVSGAANALQLDRATGEMYLRRDPTQALGAATKQYVDAGVRPINNIATPTYTLVLSDAGKLLVIQIGSTITVPANATVPIPIGAQIDLTVAAPFASTIAPAASVTIYSEDSKRKLPKLGSCGTLSKINTDTWILCGSLIA